ELLDSLLETAGKPSLDAIEQAIIAVDHTGFLVPAKTTVPELHTIADQHLFTENHKTFPSMIVASELTSLNGGAPVPTQIFRAGIPRNDGHGGFFGVEIFIPHADPTTVDRWIASGVGTHCAFRVRQRQSV